MKKLILAAAALAGACATAPAWTSPPTLLASLSALCGQAFEGEVIANSPAAPNDPFVGQRLVMHVRECGPEGVRIPLHVGEDRSRTWVVSALDAGALRLKHDHRHADGSEDALTQYGGDSASGADGLRVEFPADSFSRDLFVREAIAVSATNVWALEIEPGEALVYELARPNRLFRIRFDLTRPVDAPPPPWGAD